MKILWVCPFFPYPPNSGIRIREYNLIVYLSQKYEITLFSLLQSADEYAYVDEMRKYCAAVEAVFPQGQHAGVGVGRRSVKNVVMGILDKRPEHFYGSPFPDAADRLHALINGQHFDVLIVDTLFMSNYLWDVLPGSNMRTVLVQHNIETFIQQQQYEHETGSPIKRFRKWLYYKSFAGFERQACERYQYLMTVSEAERDQLMDIVKGLNTAHIKVIPNGVDTANNKPDASISPKSYSLIYTGAVTYNANLDAVEYFVYEVLPLVHEKVPAVMLTVTGATEGVDVSKLAAQPGVTFSGYLPSVADAIRESWAVIASLRIGGGTRLKILEAMALGTPVVSTSKGAEGIHIHPGEDILIANTPQEIADAICELFADAPLRAKLSAGGQALVKREYDWGVIGEQMASFIEEMTATGHKN